MITKISFGGRADTCKSNYNTSSVNGKNNFRGTVENGMPENIKRKERFGDIFIKNAIDRAPLLLLITGGFTAIDNLIRKVPVKKAIKNNFKWVFAPILVITSFASAIGEKKQLNKESNKKEFL